MIHNLYLLVEGGDDFRFFSMLGNVLFPKIKEPIPVEYSQKEPSKLNKMIEGFRRNPYDDYILFSDLDRFKTPYVAKISKQKRIKYLELDKTCIVCPEIESWYLAGLSKSDCIELDIHYTYYTNSVTKEKFYGAIPKRIFDDFFRKEALMKGVLEKFSINLARQRNTSFNDFYKDFIL